MGNFVPFVQSKKREKHPLKCGTCSRVAGFSFPWVFFVFLNYTKSRKASYLFAFIENFRFELAVQIGDLKTAYEIAIEADVS